MNYKQFLAIYNQGPEEVYHLLKTYEKNKIFRRTTSSDF